MIAKANVKINLGLRILEKRKDAYHNIETLFIPFYGIYDNLEVIKADDYSRLSCTLFEKYTSSHIKQSISDDAKLMITIASDKKIDWNPLDDLTAKAYFLLDKDFSLTPIKIFLEKLSPVGAGLGGGSSDAAFTLKLLNELFDLKLSLPQLVSYAEKLGSDCAFFIYNEPKFGEERGNILTNCPRELLSMDKDKKSIIVKGKEYKINVYIPENQRVSTKEAYQYVKASMEGLSIRQILEKPIDSWQEILKNDFEISVFRNFPMLEKYKQELIKEKNIYTSMSGSGSAFFTLSI